MSAQQVIIKAYYNDLAEKQPEIRRFSIDVLNNNNVYQALEKTIAQFNANYPQGQFTLQYTDEDNDRITFSSDSELRSALNALPLGGTFKVYVKPIAKKSSETSANATIHVGITCDGCEGSIIGNRYKCMECPDYDLCQGCADKNLHQQHNMAKLVKSNPSFSGFFGGQRRCGRGGFGRGRCGGAGGRFWHHFMNQQQNCNDGPAGFQMPADMTNFLGQFTGKQLAELIESHLPPYLRTEKINEMINRFKTGEQADKPIDQSALLENVGEFLREILSPFGIDCDYFVDKQTNNNTEQTEASKENKDDTASNNTSTEPKSTAPPASEAASASATATSAAPAPGFGDLIQQLHTVFGPMFQPPTSSTTTTSVPSAPSVDEQAQEQKKIGECIERMTAMGFVDTNGVLSDLIRAKKGDLNQVLDALNPRNYRN